MQRVNILMQFNSHKLQFVVFRLFPAMHVHCDSQYIFASLFFRRGIKWKFSNYNFFLGLRFVLQHANM